MNKKIKISEMKVFTDQKSLNKVAPEARKNHDDVVVVDDPTYKKMTSGDGMVGNLDVSGGISEDAGIDAVIQPQYQATLKYHSNVKDIDTDEISEPFTIGDKEYQMVIGITPNKEKVLGVYCFNDKDEFGENIIHTHEYFETNIAKPALEEEKRSQLKEEPLNDNNGEFFDLINLKDVNGYRHFFVNIRTGKISAKFKSIKEMMKSGVKLGDDEDYMDSRTLKHFRFRDIVGSNNVVDEGIGVNMADLKTDVEKLTNLIMDKFRIAFDKINTLPEQKEFITVMAKKLGIASQNLSSLFSNIKSTVTQDVTTQQVAESRKVIKTIKIKDIK